MTNKQQATRTKSQVSANASIGKERLSIAKIIRIARLLREIGDNMTLLQVEALLIIMENEGITQPELGKLLNTTQATVSRTCTKLAGTMFKDPRTGKWVEHGLGLIDSREDSDDARRVALSLSDKGKRLRETLRQIE